MTRFRTNWHRCGPRTYRDSTDEISLGLTDLPTSSPVTLANEKKHLTASPPLRSTRPTCPPPIARAMPSSDIVDNIVVHDEDQPPPKKPKRFQCIRCQRFFGRLEHLQRHERTRKLANPPQPAASTQALPNTCLAIVRLSYTPPLSL